MRKRRNFFSLERQRVLTRIITKWKRRVEEVTHRERETDKTENERYGVKLWMTAEDVS